MAANLNAANFGKRILILNRNLVTSSSASASAPRRPRRASRGSASSTAAATAATAAAAYEKNIDDQIRPSVIVPDHMIHPISENYWVPHPQTGVFEPPTPNNNHHTPTPITTTTTGRTGGGGRDHPGQFAATTLQGPSSSVLEQKAWFRPTGLEDLEKPHFL